MKIFSFVGSLLLFARVALACEGPWGALKLSDGTILFPFAPAADVDRICIMPEGDWGAPVTACTSAESWVAGGAEVRLELAGGTVTLHPCAELADRRIAWIILRASPGTRWQWWSYSGGLGRGGGAYVVP